MVRHHHVIIFMLLLCGLCRTASAKDVIKFNNNFYDETKTVNRADKATLEKILRDFELDTSGTLAVVIIDKLGNQRIDTYCQKVAQANKIGSQDNKGKGMLCLISPKESKLWVYVGDAWKDTFSTKKIEKITWKIMPFFRLGQFKDGIIHFVYNIQKKLTGNAPDIPRQHIHESLMSYFVTGGTLAILIILVSFIFRLFSDKGQTLQGTKRKRLEHIYAIKYNTNLSASGSYIIKENELLKEKQRFGGDGASGRW